MRQVAPPAVHGAIRANDFVSPLPGRWRGGWEGEDSELQLSACATSQGQDCTTLTDWHYLRPCPASSSVALDARFAGNYLRVADRRIGPGPHPRAAYAVSSPYGGKAWTRSRNTSVAVVGQIAPAVLPNSGECGPLPPGEAFVSKQGTAYVRCRGGCRAELVASHAGRRVRVVRTLAPQNVLVVRPPVRLRVPRRAVNRIGGGRVRFVVRTDGKRAAYRAITMNR